MVVPSLPGFGFSGPLRETGWTIGRIAGACAELMAGSATTGTASQGGDVGAGIVARAGRRSPRTGSSASTSTTLIAVPVGDVRPIREDLTPRRSLARLEEHRQRDRA